MKNITVGNTVKIYERCRKDVQWAYFYKREHSVERGSVNKAHFVTQPDLVITPMINHLYMGLIFVEYLKW